MATNWGIQYGTVTSDSTGSNKGKMKVDLPGFGPTASFDQVYGMGKGTNVKAQITESLGKYTASYAELHDCPIPENEVVDQSGNGEPSLETLKKGQIVSKEPTIVIEHAPGGPTKIIEDNPAYHDGDLVFWYRNDILGYLDCGDAGRAIRTSELQVSQEPLKSVQQ